MASRPSPELLLHLRRLATKEGEPPTDDQLLRQFVGQRNDDAFAAIVGRYGPLVLRVCRQALVDGHDAEDAFQATFLVLARKASCIGRRERLAGWLYGVAHRVAARARARAARRRACERPVADVVATEPFPGGRELWDVLHEEVLRLPAKYRLPVILCYLEGRTNDEAARYLGWPKGTVSGRLARARDRLYQRLTRRGLAAPAGGRAVLLWAGSALAAIPGTLAGAAVAAARAFASGPAGSAAVSTSVASLAEGALKAMFVTKLKTLAITVLLAVAVIGVGLVAAGSQVSGDGRRPRDEVKENTAIPPRPLPLAPGPLLTTVLSAPDRPGPRDGPKEPMRLHKLEIATPGRLAFSPVGKTLVHAVNRGVRSWDVVSGKSHSTWGHEDWRVKDLAPDGTTVAMTSVKGLDPVRLFEASSGKERCTLDGRYTLSSNYFIYSPNAKLLVQDSFDRDRNGDVVYTVRIWDAVTGKEQPSLTKGFHQGVMRSPAVSPDGKYLAVGCDPTDILLYDLAKREKVRQFGEKRAPELGPDDSSPSRIVAITAVAFSPDGSTLAAGDNDGNVVLYETATGKKKTRLGDGPKSLKQWSPCVRQILFSPNGGMLVALDSYLGAPRSGDFGEPGDKERLKLHLWDIATGKEHAPLKLEGTPRFVALAPNGRNLAVVVTSEKKVAWIEVWEVP
jgi:RNA polymerase sigma factor (sigma-70 family)